jgi:hypothetical protein
MWKETAVVKFKVISLHLLEGTEEILERPQSGFSVSGSRVGPGIFQLDIESNTA